MSVNSYKQYEKELIELRREKSLQYALDLIKLNKIDMPSPNVNGLVGIAKVVEKYLKDGE